ncbi:MAG: hypothetical protein KBT88_15765 [Gammaproteobacteria bacterium]|nr:hypothetical protein [Gammaproteobacteria bacterium]MBQ0841238.1 hypothetical protein [Gammaproteobacteria bacterium]
MSQVHRLMDFREPREEIWEEIKSYLSQMVPNEMGACEDEFNNEESAISTLEECLCEVKTAIRKDYSENILEEDSAPWLFSYVVEKYSDSEINILTKLLSKTKLNEGDILYGIAIRRSSKGGYMVSSDYDRLD